jgi:type VI protein secretion system component VasK
MGFILWIVLALLASGLLVYLASLRTRRLLPAMELPHGEKLPSTALQKHASWALIVVCVLTAVAAGLVIHFGAQTWWDSDPVRLTVTGVLITALVAYLMFTLTIRALESRDDGAFDERDGAILARSHAGVGGAMMVVVAAWMVALTEAYRETHLVPSYYLYLMFWSCVMTNVIASIAGILLAYRRG